MTRRLWLVLMGAVLFPISSMAATITVDSTDEWMGKPSICTLDAAIQSVVDQEAVDGCAAPTVGSNVIDLPANATFTRGSVTYATEFDGNSCLPTFNGSIQSLTINGNGSTITRSDGSSACRLMLINGIIFINNLTISNFEHEEVGDAGGSAFLVKNLLKVSNVTFTGHNSSKDGGVIMADQGSFLIVESSTFRDNMATYAGGAISLRGSTAVINRMTCSGNSAFSGGCIASADSTMTITNSTISYNAANSSDDQDQVSGLGGGVGFGGGTGVIRGSSIFGNTADIGGGIGALLFATPSQTSQPPPVVGTLSIENSHIFDNTARSLGGGIFNVETQAPDGSKHEIAIRDSTVVYNHATLDGGVGNTHKESTFTIRGSLISDNDAEDCFLYVTSNGANGLDETCVPGSSDTKVSTSGASCSTDDTDPGEQLCTLACDSPLFTESSALVGAATKCTGQVDTGSEGGGGSSAGGGTGGTIGPFDSAMGGGCSVIVAKDSVPDLMIIAFFFLTPVLVVSLRRIRR